MSYPNFKFCIRSRLCRWAGVASVSAFFLKSQISNFKFTCGTATPCMAVKTEHERVKEKRIFQNMVHDMRYSFDAKFIIVIIQLPLKFSRHRADNTLQSFCSLPVGAHTPRAFLFYQSGDCKFGNSVQTCRVRINGNATGIKLNPHKRLMLVHHGRKTP